MSKSQKVLRVFAVLELISGILVLVGMFMGQGGGSRVASVVVSLLSAYLLLAAAKDASKIMGAWWITLLDLILSVFEVMFAFNGGADGQVVVGTVLGVVLNLIVFLAANNVKKQAKQ